MKPTRLRPSLIALTIASLVSGNAMALKLEEAVAKAVVGNPEVREKWHAFAAAGHETAISWGRYLPTLDVVYGVGEESSDPTTFDGSYRFDNTAATAKMNLFEGFGAKYDVDRLRHAELVRFYEVLGISETAASEAARAYVDLYRYRRLVEMAEENLATHRAVFDRINERVKSGVGRGVDLEMAAGRLALAESNLITEHSNLHDVTARYQRIVGDLPSVELDPIPSLAKQMPKSREDAVKRGLGASPHVKASLENVLSASREVGVKRAGYYPRVDAYATADRERNLEGIAGVAKHSAYGATADWNIFRGLQDSRRSDRAQEFQAAAMSLRQRVCHEVRQSLATTFNDYLRLTDQLAFLDQHQLSTDKARQALIKQFEIGQRSLLDVLDTENEFYTARRNYLGGEMDLTIAQVRYLAAAGELIKVLGINRLEMTPPASEVDEEELSILGDAGCSAVPPAPGSINKEAVFQRLKARDDMLRAPQKSQ